jgi:hypothetical protein
MTVGWRHFLALVGLTLRAACKSSASSQLVHPAESKIRPKSGKDSNGL